MTPEERQIIQSVGMTLLQDTMDQTASYLAYGIFAPISAIMVYYLMSQKGAATYSQRSILAIICLSFVTLTVNEIIQTTMNKLEYDFLILNASLVDRIDTVNQSLTNFDIIASWLTLLQPVLNDAIIIWRAWTIFHSRRWALYLSIALCLSTFGITMAYLCLMTINSQYAAQEVFSNTTIVVLATMTSWASVVTNIVATSFIGYTLLKYLKLFPNRQLLQMRPILLLLVESGAIYSILQLVNAIMQLALPNTDTALFAYDVFSGFYVAITMVYPTLSIALIRGPFSMVEVHKSVMSVHIMSQRRPAEVFPVSDVAPQDEMNPAPVYHYERCE